MMNSQASCNGLVRMLTHGDLAQARVRSIGQPNPLSDTGGRARGACRTRSGQGQGSRAKPAESPGAPLRPIGLATTSAAKMATIDFLSLRMANTVFEIPQPFAADLSGFPRPLQI